MCSAYLSKPLRTEEQAIIDLIRSGSHVVVPREATDDMLAACVQPIEDMLDAVAAGLGGISAIGDAAWGAMVARGAITLTDRQKESD